MAETTETAETIAAKMRDAVASGGFAAWGDCVADHVDTMNMVHDPPGGPMDGPVTGDQLRALYNFEAVEMYPKVFPDGYTVTGPVRVEGNDVVTEFTMAGVTADGTPMNYTSLTNWTVENGRIVECLAKAVGGEDAAQGREALMKAMADSGAPMPTAADLGLDR
jgi:ketosteroid isomerase-like protein